MLKTLKTIAFYLITGLMFMTTSIETTDFKPVKVVFEEPEVEVEVKTIEPVMVSAHVEEPVEEIIEESNEEELLSQEEIELIALVTMAEAEGEPEEGKRLVIDTILNRMDSNRFPDTVTEVIYQPNQFEAIWNGRVDRCYVMDEICQLVREELENRTNHEVLFFTAGGYGKYGTPLFQVENHYFCKS